MVAIYVRRIREGKMTIDDVPERWRDAVREALGEN
jgi:hypothetical protein